MSATAPFIAEDMVRRMAIPGFSNTYALGCFGRLVTFSSQQARAFNLIWGLFQTGRLGAEDSVAVVGAGLGGLSAAAAALCKQCRVDLYEQASQLCALQRGNDTRFVHPYILRWPDPVCHSDRTAFPYLNWTAANVRGVVKQVEAAWHALIRGDKPLSHYMAYRVTGVGTGSDGRPWVSANRQDNADDQAFLHKGYDCVILAVGFGDERSLPGVPFLSYWENDSLHQELVRAGEPKRVLVSGCGDGGLIDALRLRVRNFDHAEFVRFFNSTPALSSLALELQQIDNDYSARRTASDIGRELMERYDKLSIPDTVKAVFHSRTDTHVTLNSPLPNPLNFRASLLNRFAVYLAVRFSGLRYLPGQIRTTATAGRRIQVSFESPYRPPYQEEFDQVIVRHGPESALRKLIPTRAAEELETNWVSGDDLTVQPYWDSGDPFYPPAPPLSLPPSVVLELALDNFSSAYRQLYDGRSVASMAVGREGEGYIITLLPGVAAKGRITEFAGVPVRYRETALEETAAPERPARSARKAPSEVRPLPIGSGVYNASSRERRAIRKSEASTQAQQPPDSSSPVAPFVGTVTCFVQDGNQIYLLSAGHVLDPDEDAMTGDEIFLENESRALEHRPIAYFERRIKLNPSEPNPADAAIARLAENVQPAASLLGGAQVTFRRAGEPKPGEHVLRIGRTTSRTEGSIRRVDHSVVIAVGLSRPVWFNYCFEVESLTDKDFALPGDSGALIVSEPTKLGLGILLASSRQETGPQIVIACSLKKALEVLNVKLAPVSG